MRETYQVPKLSSEMCDVELGDERLNRRLCRLIERISEHPSDSFPKMLDEAELEAAYRFFGNDRVSPDAILEPHFQATSERARCHDHVVVAHDTTEFEFPGESQREGLGRLLRPGQGFFGHFALAMTVERLPLGLLGLMTMFRLDEPSPQRRRHDQNTRGESARWRQLAAAAENRLQGGTHAIHVMDREGDSYATLSEFADENRSYVIRSCHDRRLVDGEQKLWERARTSQMIVEREVQLSRRPHKGGPKQSKRHPARQQRTAKLGLARISADLPRTQTPVAREAHARLRVGVIHVSEIDPPAGEPPVEWILLTNLPLETAAQVEFAVDCYRARWLVEEFFKALKTGCQYEKRQLESSHSLLNALAVLAPVAWRLLLLRHLARNAPDTPAQQALTPTQLAVLNAVAKKPLPEKPTVRDALLAVASLGGHLTNNGEPGWIVLGRGFHDLLLMEMAWRAAKCDQS